VLPLLREARGRIEAARELPADVLDALHEAGLFRLLLPRSLGGDELDLASHAQVIEAIASADASTGWVMGQGAGCAMAAAFLAPEVTRRLFGPSDAVLAWGAGIQGKATVVPGGYRVTGTWTFASGLRHATILGGHSHILEPDGRPRLRPDGSPLDRTLLFPRASSIIHDVWQVVGLKGTGSDTFEVRDLFVPEEATIDRLDPAELREAGTLYKFSASLAYGAGFGGLMLGIARGMLDDLRELALTKTQRGATMSLRESPVFQTQMATLEARLRAARAYHLGTLREVWQAVEARGAITLQERVDCKLASTWIINQAFEVASEAYRAAGQSAIFPTAMFEQRMRDALTASQQAQARATNYLTAGRTLLGLPPDTMMFL
jgi:alkylation response protein AidB-like acyl-CoA dehydrogenase